MVSLKVMYNIVYCTHRYL